jgi:(1->4)-alpha-D-glucan 1-alpha-D-glucosylmutase
MEKAMREAKVHTSWTNPNGPYESAVKDFVARVVGEGRFLADFVPFQRCVAEFGMLNSLSQTLLRLTAPGVPDTYQGTELWDFSLVDPDNRRPVDYERRRQIMEGLERGVNAADLLESRTTGAVKLYVTRRALQARRDHPGLFTTGEYLPMSVEGAAERGHIFAFARRLGDRWALAVVPRLFTSLVHPGQMPVGPAVWHDTRLALPAGLRLRNVFTGVRMTTSARPAPVAEVLADFPVALLLSE